MSMTLEIPTTQSPAEPLFVACHGVPYLDQNEKEQAPIQVKSPPASDGEDQNATSDVENDQDERALKNDEDYDSSSDDSDGMYLSEINYQLLPDTDNNNSSLIKGSSDSLFAITKDSARNEMKKVLVPVRDPVTRKIKNELVPVEVKDETGLNIIKSVLIPIQAEDGLVSYEIKKVIVPMRPELSLPLKNGRYSSIVRDLSLQTSVDSPPIASEKIKSLSKNIPKPMDDQKLEEDRSEKRNLEKVKEEKHEGKKEGNKINSESKDLLEETVDRVSENMKNICPYCQKFIDDPKKLDKHVRRNHTKPYRCDKCYRTYVSKESYEEHLKSHEKESYVECPFCRQRYRRMAGLRQHQIRVHSTIEARFECDDCGKRFKLKSDLVMHIERTHVNVTHVCRFCGKSVRNIMHHEWQHEKIAKKVKFQYHCHLCPSKFRRQNGLENHLLMHKSGFKCDKCAEIFSRPSALARHKDAKHKPGMFCTICEKEFQYRGNFYQHVISHAGVRPYKCDICGEDFTHRVTFIRHRNSHPGPLPPLSVTQIADIAKKILENN